MAAATSSTEHRGRRAAPPAGWRAFRRLGRDFGRSRPSRLVGLDGGMFVGAESVADASFDTARARLVNLARGGWLAAASGEVFGDPGQDLALVGPAPGLSRLVEVRFRDLMTRGKSAVLTLRWEVAGPGGGLFPVLDADITLSPYGERGTLLALEGVYRAPLGAVGAALDRALLGQVAVATVRRFMDRLGEAIADPASATDRAAGSQEHGFWRFTVVPGQI